MASADESPGNGSSKKRVASRQISKDDDPEVEEEETPMEGGTFRRAPEAVLANRRIVKVRRTPGAGAAPAAAAANPFASIRLVPPSVAEAAAVPTNPKADPIVEVPEADMVKAEESEVKDLNQSVEETTITETVTTETVTTETVTEVVEETVISEAKETEEKTGITNGEKVDEKVVEKGGARGDGAALGPSGSSSETFQQLSSAKNAFSGSFGTGFSASSITFGSTLSTPSTGFGAFTTGGAFGGSGSAFGSGSTFGSGLFGSSSGTTAFPSLNSVFGKSNGSSTFQLFGSSPAAATAPPPSTGAPTSTGMTLQEVPVETGEEKEKAVFAADASLFEFLDGGWKERGRGEIKVNVREDAQRRSRLVMRSKGNLRLLLNANIFPDMKITKMDNRGVTFACVNSTNDAKAGLTTYALKMKDPQIAGEFLSTVEIHKGSTTNAGEPRTPESSPKAVERPAKVAEEAPRDLEAGGGSETASVNV